MMRRPRLLDLFCGAGGASEGYRRAGFDVAGVDLAAQPRYPFEFHQGDALEFLRRHASEFDAVHASPPCKVHTSMKAFSSAHHVDLVEETREALRATGKPWVIENVPGAPLMDPLVLCGSSFGLGVRRHRLFESSVAMLPLACDHEAQDAASPRYPVKRYHTGKPEITMSPVIGVFGRGQGLGPGEVGLWREAMGIDWMTRDELSQAIPPDYTEYVGEYLIKHLSKVEAPMEMQKLSKDQAVALLATTCRQLSEARARVRELQGRVDQLAAEVTDLLVGIVTDRE